MGGISSDVLEFLQKVLIMHELKTGFNADKFATFGCFQKVFIAYSLDCPIREHAEHCNFFASTSRNKKFALRAASSL